MQLASKAALLQRYANLADGELTVLNTERDQLTPEACAALHDEMTKRGLPFDIPPDCEQPPQTSELPPEVEYPSAALVIETADDYRYDPTPEMFRKQLEAGAKLRDEAALAKVFMVLAMTAITALTVAVGRDNSLILLLTVTAVVPKLYVTFKLRRFECPQCSSRVANCGRLVRCPSCRLQIYPLR